jgi:hypothetical protein
MAARLRVRVPPPLRTKTRPRNGFGLRGLASSAEPPPCSGKAAAALAQKILA